MELVVAIPQAKVQQAQSLGSIDSSFEGHLGYNEVYSDRQKYLFNSVKDILRCGVLEGIEDDEVQAVTYYVGDKQYGPFSLNKLSTWVQAGQMKMNYLVEINSFVIGAGLLVICRRVSQLLSEGPVTFVELEEVKKIFYEVVSVGVKVAFEEFVGFQLDPMTQVQDCHQLAKLLKSGPP
eukprot:TRINITY_DN16584_c0_g1_i1.p1 TRINITY_DN16584_c0_g1~~TRINITY_DN16584_c0_g1_i1.p1  ORF type:complete len:207 (-),score=18.13 TRINITY_DN16584_c0_g1_i1:67-603(-)